MPYDREKTAVTLTPATKSLLNDLNLVSEEELLNFEWGDYYVKLLLNVLNFFLFFFFVAVSIWHL